MSSRYKINDQQGIHFLTSTCIGWVDVFTSKIYRDILIESLRHCQEEKGLRLFAFVIMSNHIHYIASGNEKNSLSDIVRDFKKFTSSKIKKAMLEGPESREEWMMSIFTIAGKTNPANQEFQLWKNDNHPEELYTFDFMKQKLDYLHANPVRAGFVASAEDWVYSSASNYAGLGGLLEVELLI